MKFESSVVNMDPHLANRNTLRKKKTKGRRIEKERAKMIGIITAQQINIKILLRIDRDCHMMVISRRVSESEITRVIHVKTS